MNDELKPCPFCGGNPILRTVIVFGCHSWEINCPKCPLIMSSRRTVSSSDKDFMEKEKESVTNYWNSRYEKM